MLIEPVVFDLIYFLVVQRGHLVEDAHQIRSRKQEWPATPQQPHAFMPG